MSNSCFCIIVSYICHAFFYCYKLSCNFVSFFKQLTKTFGSKCLGHSNSNHVHKAQIKTITSTINMIKKIYNIILLLFLKCRVVTSSFHHVGGVCYEGKFLYMMV